MFRKQGITWRIAENQQNAKRNVFDVCKYVMVDVHIYWNIEL